MRYRGDASRHRKRARPLDIDVIGSGPVDATNDHDDDSDCPADGCHGRDGATRANDVDRRQCRLQHMATRSRDAIGHAHTARAANGAGGAQR